MRQAERRAMRNQAARSSVRTYVKKASDAVRAATADAAEVVRQAVRALDKAAQKGIVHRNAAARRKSRLMTRLHQISAAAAAPVVAAESKARTPARRGTASRATGAPTTRKPAAAPRRPSTRAKA
jgi:small subunit ribosomal protein S20